MTKKIPEIEGQNFWGVTERISERISKLISEEKNNRFPQNFPNRFPQNFPNRFLQICLSGFPQNSPNGFPQKNSNRFTQNFPNGFSTFLAGPEGPHWWANQTKVCISPASGHRQTVASQNTPRCQTVQGC